MSRRRWQLVGVLIGAIALVTVALVVSRGSHKTATQTVSLAPASTTSTTTSTSTSTTTTQPATSTTTASTSVPIDPETTTSTVPDTVPLEPTRSRGHVVDEAGDPIPGIIVRMDGRDIGQGTDLAVTDANGDYDVECRTYADPRFAYLLLMSQPRWWDFGGPGTGYAFTYVGGTADPSTAPQAPCMTPDEAPITTVMHPGGVITGRFLDSAGNPFPAPEGSFRQMLLDLNTCEGSSPEHVIALSGREVSDVYRIIGLPPGDHCLNAEGRPGVWVHIDAGSTTVYDWRL